MELDNSKQTIERVVQTVLRIPRFVYDRSTLRTKALNAEGCEFRYSI